MCVVHVREPAVLKMESQCNRLCQSVWASSSCFAVCSWRPDQRTSFVLRLGLVCMLFLATLALGKATARAKRAPLVHTFDAPAGWFVAWKLLLSKVNFFREVMGLQKTEDEIKATLR